MRFPPMRVTRRPRMSGRKIPITFPVRLKMVMIMDPTAVLYSVKYFVAPLPKPTV